MPGDSLHFNARILPFRQNANPGEFSYARYLKQKNVFFHLLPVSPIRQNGHSDDLYTVFDHLRKKWLSKTHRLFSDSTCCQLVNALCLGYKNDLDSEVQNLFISTGTVHLLSVSGLHTGAIYLFILFIFKSIGFLPVKLLLWYSRFFGVTFVSPVYPHPLSGLQRSFLLFISVNISTDPIPP